MTVVDPRVLQDPAAEALFAGPGEMRARCRAIDWAATPLGAVAGWPAALRLAVRVCFDSGFAKCIYAGPELVLIYNDAFRRALGAPKHPSALGRPAREVWPEIWTQLGPEFAKLLAGGPPAHFANRPFVLDRDGRTEETFWTATRAPVRDDDGRVVAVQTVSFETTDLVRAERTLRASEARQAYLVKLGDALRPLAAPAAVKAAGCRLLGEHLHANRVFYAEADGDEWLVEGGFEHDVPPLPLGKHAAEGYGLPLADRLRAGARVVSGDPERDADLTPEERQTRLRLRIKSAVAVPLVKEGRIVAVCQVQCATTRSWTDDDLAVIEETAERTWSALERARAEAALRASEAKYRSLFEAMGQGYAECELVRGADGRATDFRFIELNPAFERLAGIEVDRARGRLAEEVLPGIDAWWLETFERVVRSGRPERVEHEVAPLERWYQAHVYPRAGDRFTVLYEDITARRAGQEALRASEERQAFLLDLSDALRPLADAAEVQATAARILGEALRADRVYFGEMRESEGVAIVRAEYLRGPGPSVVGVYRYGDFRETIAGMQTGHAYVMPDVQRSEALSVHTRAAYAALGLAAFVTVPLIKAGRLVWSLTVASGTPRAWTAQEIAIQQETAERAWDAAQRAVAETALHETQRRLEDALATARMAYWDRDASTGATVASRSMDELFGLLSGEPFPDGPQRFALVHPDDRERYCALADEAGARGQGWRAEFRIVRPRDGEIVWLEERATVTRDPATGATHTTGLVWDITDRKRAEAAADHERREAERDALRRELAAAEERERRRLARELHDQLGQHLTAFALGLADVRRLLRGGASADARLAQLEALAQAMASDARYLALELRPPELDDVGLESALETYVAEWSARYGIAAEVAVTGAAFGQALPAEVASALYRIVQEALTNVAKHAGARQVSVLLEKPEREARLIVEDDGRGFDPEATRARAKAERRLGLASMRERAELLGGEVEVESRVGRGTTVYVRVPLPA